MKLLFFLLISSFAYASERPRTPIALPSSGDSIITIESEDDVLCASALNYIAQHGSGQSFDLRSYVREVVLEARSSPIADQINPEFVAMLAYQRALDSHQQKLNELITKTHSRVSKKSTAAICGLCTTVFSGLVAILVHYNQKC